MNTHIHPRQTGRKITPERMRYVALAKTAQLGTVERYQLENLAKTLPCTGLVTCTEAFLLQVLINTAPSTAYADKAQPVVFKSNRQLAFEINRSESRVSAMLSRLFDAGLITFTDSANFKRYAARSATGELTAACGIDLRILVTRFEELTECVRRAQAEAAAMSRDIHRYRGILRRFNDLLLVIEDAPSRLLRRFNRIATIVGRPKQSDSVTLRRATALIERLIEQVAGVEPSRADRETSTKTISLLIENAIHIQNTNPYQPVESNERRSADASHHQFDKAGSASKRAFEESLSGRLVQDKPNPSMLNEMPALEDLLRATPALETWGIQPRTWSDLIRAIPQMSVCAGISPDARDRAVRQMGDQAAAVAIAITIQKQDTREVTSPGGYLRAMTERAAIGELHLARSVYALVSRHRTGALN